VEVETAPRARRSLIRVAAYQLQSKLPAELKGKLSSRAPGLRHNDHELRTFSGCALDGNLSAMGFNDGLDEAQTQAQAAL
jgi:hypothetical protein